MEGRKLTQVALQKMRQPLQPQPQNLTRRYWLVLRPTRRSSQQRCCCLAAAAVESFAAVTMVWLH
jgi:hypothetical protein